MNDFKLFALAFVLLTVPYPLISAGTLGESGTLWGAGLALLTIGACIPPLTRFVTPEVDTA